MYREHSLVEYEQLTKLQNTYELIRRLSFGEKLIITDYGQKTYGRKRPQVKPVLKVWCKSTEGWSETFVKVETSEEKELLVQYQLLLANGFRVVAVEYDDLRRKLRLTINEGLSLEWFDHVCKVWG